MPSLLISQPSLESESESENLLEFKSKGIHVQLQHVLQTGCVFNFFQLMHVFSLFAADISNSVSHMLYNMCCFSQSIAWFLYLQVLLYCQSVNQALVALITKQLLHFIFF